MEITFFPHSLIANHIWTFILEHYWTRGGNLRKPSNFNGFLFFKFLILVKKPFLKNNSAHPLDQFCYKIKFNSKNFSLNHNRHFPIPNEKEKFISHSTLCKFLSTHTLFRIQSSIEFNFFSQNDTKWKENETVTHNYPLPISSII